jgi:ABC-2 type transport system permease protein
MSKILLLGLNDLRLTLKDRQSLIWMILLPIFLMWIFSHVNFSGGSGTNQVSLSLVDHDGGWLARAFIEELKDEQIALHEFHPDSLDLVEQKVRTLHIPMGFTEGALAGEQQTLELQREPGSNSDYSMAAEVHIIRTAVRSIARLTELKQTKLIADDRADSSFAAMGDRDTLVDLKVSTAGQGRRVPSGQAQSVPGILVMTVLMMTIIYGGTYLTIEKQSGMLERQMSLPVGRGHVIMGKLAGRLIIALAQTAVLLVAGKLITWLSFGEPMSYGNSLPGLILLITSYAIACTGLATLLGAVLKTPEQAGSVGWLLSMGLAALGGCWWPMEVTPRWFQSAAHILPTAWAMDGFHALISFGYGIGSVLQPSAVLLGFGLLFSILGIRFLKTKGSGA